MTPGCCYSLIFSLSVQHKGAKSKNNMSILEKHMAQGSLTQKLTCLSRRHAHLVCKVRHQVDLSLTHSLTHTHTLSLSIPIYLLLSLYMYKNNLSLSLSLSLSLCLCVAFCNSCLCNLAWFVWHFACDVSFFSCMRLRALCACPMGKASLRRH